MTGNAFSSEVVAKRIRQQQEEAFAYDSFYAGICSLLGEIEKLVQSYF